MGESGFFFDKWSGREDERRFAAFVGRLRALGANRKARFHIPTSRQKKAAPRWVRAASFLTSGRGERIRTSDPHNPIVVRYQAALRPDRVLADLEDPPTENLLGGNHTRHAETWKDKDFSGAES